MSEVGALHKDTEEGQRSFGQDKAPPQKGRTVIRVESAETQDYKGSRVVTSFWATKKEGGRVVTSGLLDSRGSAGGGDPEVGGQDQNVQGRKHSLSGVSCKSQVGGGEKSVGWKDPIVTEMIKQLPQDKFVFPCMMYGSRRGAVLLEDRIIDTPVDTRYSSASKTV